jgi:hypothetical protein
MHTPISLVLEEKAEGDEEKEDEASFSWIVGPISGMHPPFLLKKQLVCS